MESTAAHSLLHTGLYLASVSKSLFCKAVNYGLLAIIQAGTALHPVPWFQPRGLTALGWDAWWEQLQPWWHGASVDTQQAVPSHVGPAGWTRMAYAFIPSYTSGTCKVKCTKKDKVISDHISPTVERAVKLRSLNNNKKIPSKIFIKYYSQYICFFKIIL